MAIVFRNRKAAFLWGFAALWLALLFTMTYVLARDGLPAEYPPLAVAGGAAFFWVGGIGLALYVLSKPCLFVSIEDGGHVSVAWRYPHKVVRKRLSAASLRPAVVVEGQDDESSPYFYARVATADAEQFDIAEGHTRSLCQDACEKFNRTLRDHLEASRNALQQAEEA